jgi:hypothetical protein
MIFGYKQIIKFEFNIYLFNIIIIMNYDVDVELKLIIDHLDDVIKKLDTMNFNELHIEQQNYESTKSRLYDLEEEIKKTRVKLTNVFKNVMSKVNSLYSKEDNKILITHEKNLSTINAIITNLENNMDQMDINELNDHLIWMKKIDAELKINYIKLYHFSMEPELFKDTYLELWRKYCTLKKMYKEEIEQTELNEYHNSVGDIVNSVTYHQKFPLLFIIDNETNPVLDLVSFIQKTNYGTANISELIGKKTPKTRNYEVDIYKSGSVACSCSNFKRNKNILCKHICFLICSIGKIIKLDFFENKKLSKDEINKITEQINVYLVN